MMGIAKNKITKIAYVHDEELRNECNKISQIRGRGHMVHSLIDSYGLLSDVEVISSTPATENELLSFHSRDYIEYLQNANDSNDLEKVDDQFGLGYDCPLIEKIYEFVQRVAGGSLCAADAIINDSAECAINWYGGWHHAQRDEAEGFCYVNDIVLAIHRLREKFDRILYIDLDIHHGNGVENAFAFTPKVLTFSIHKYEPGFYPCSGTLSDVGFGKGRYYAVNAPMKDGLKQESFCHLFNSIVAQIWTSFRPDVVVMQCGADSLIQDPLGTFNLTPEDFGKCVRTVMGWEIPVLYLGGGGYNLPNAARCWTYLTSVIVGKDIPEDIPEDDNYFTRYGPDYVLSVSRGCQSDKNSEEYVAEVIQVITENLENIDNGC